jgi:hypothetical protein
MKTFIFIILFFIPALFAQTKVELKDWQTGGRISGLLIISNYYSDRHLFIDFQSKDAYHSQICCCDDTFSGVSTSAKTRFSFYGGEGGPFLQLEILKKLYSTDFITDVNQSVSFKVNKYTDKQYKYLTIFFPEDVKLYDSTDRNKFIQICANSMILFFIEQKE